MMKINCLIVDDEPLSQDVIVDFVNACPELNLCGVCNDALEAGEFLKKEKIDLLFLDINMPRLSGIGFVKSLKEPPLFIFITAYPEYALEGFEVDAVDYLVKPVAFDRFRKTINRVVQRISELNEQDQAQHIMVRANKKNYRLALDDLLYLEAQGDYVKFITTSSSLMVHGRLKDFLAQLQENKFQQVHKSYVVNLSKVVYLEGNQVKVDDHKVPVSLSFRDKLMGKLNR